MLIVSKTEGVLILWLSQMEFTSKCNWNFEVNITMNSTYFKYFHPKLIIYEFHQNRVKTQRHCLLHINRYMYLTCHSINSFPLYSPNFPSLQLNEGMVLPARWAIIIKLNKKLHKISQIARNYIKMQFFFLPCRDSVTKLNWMRINWIMEIQGIISSRIIYAESSNL